MRDSRIDLPDERQPAIVSALSRAFHLIRTAGFLMKYMCIAYEEERKLNELSEAEWQALRQETLDYVEDLRTSGRLVVTHALQSATTASTVRVRGGRLSITDGPFAETKEQIGGFFLIEANDFDEAIQIAANWPSARIGSIEVRPIEEELNMDRRYGGHR